MAIQTSPSPTATARRTAPRRAGQPVLERAAPSVPIAATAVSDPIPLCSTRLFDATLAMVLSTSSRRRPTPPGSSSRRPRTTGRLLRQ